MKITSTFRVHEFLQKNAIQYLVLEVELIEEPCTQIYNPIVKALTKIPDSDVEFIEQWNGIKFYMSSIFRKKFSVPETLSLTIKGLFRKKLTISNLQPLIENICKVDFTHLKTV